MIKIGDKVYRNLEEQVQANKNDIQRIIEGEELLARLGIKVVGQVEGNADLPNPVTYPGDFGDAYLVGTQPPYDYFIFTRPFEGETDAQWFDLGPFPVAGPQGPQGPQGPKGADGKRGSQWFSGTGQPATTSGYNIGDYYINVGTGNIWHLHDVEGVPKWLLEGNIRGPQGPVGPIGPAGPQGEQGMPGQEGPMGPAASTVEIIGIYSSIDTLPNPETEAPRNAGALVGTPGSYDVYIVTGDEDGLYWTNAGPFNAGSVVTVNGIAQPTWNADTKLNTGPSMEYKNNLLYVYKMENGNRTNEYIRMRGDAFDARNDDSGITSQLNYSSLVINRTQTADLPSDVVNRANYGSNYIALRWGSNTSTEYRLRFPKRKSGTIAFTSDITASEENIKNDITTTKNELINSLTTKGYSNWKAAGARDNIYPEVDKARIMLLRVNGKGKWTYRFTNEAGNNEVQAKVMVVFIPSAAWSDQNYRVWIMTIDDGTIMPSIGLSTYNVIPDNHDWDDVAMEYKVLSLGEFIPPAGISTDVYELVQ